MGTPPCSATGAAADTSGGEERADDQLGAVVQRAFRGDPRALGRALGVLGDQRHVRIVEVEQGELGRLLQRLGHGGRRARGADRQQHRDLDGAGRAGDAGGARTDPAAARRAASGKHDAHQQAREDEPAALPSDDRC